MQTTFQIILFRHKLDMNVNTAMGCIEYF